MGCTDEIIEPNQFYNAYTSIKEVYLDIRKKENIKIDVYLISTASIPKFAEILRKSEIFEKIEKSEEKKVNKIENKLKAKFNDYELEQEEIKIYYSFQDYKDISKSENIDKDNEFFITNEKFLYNMRIFYEDRKHMKVLLSKNNNSLKIIFKASGKVIEIKEKNGFFSFAINNIDKNK